MSVKPMLVRQTRRMFTFGFALRVTILLSGMAALWLAVPQLERWELCAVIITPVPLLAAYMPDKPFAPATLAQAVILLLINGYIAVDPTPMMAIGIGVFCYLHHACAAMAALWRVDTKTDPVVWRGFLTRISVVVAVSTVLAGAVTVVSGDPIEGPPALLTAAAACAVLAVIATIAYLFHRRSV